MTELLNIGCPPPWRQEEPDKILTVKDWIKWKKFTEENKARIVYTAGKIFKSSGIYTIEHDISWSEDNKDYKKFDVVESKRMVKELESMNS